MEVGLEGMLIVLTLWFLLRERDKAAAPGFAVSASLLALSRPEAMLVTLVLAGMYIMNALRRSRAEGRWLPSMGVLLSAAGSLAGIIIFAVNNYAGAGTLATNTFKADSILNLPYATVPDKLGAIADTFLQTYPAALGNLGPPPIAAGLFLLFMAGLAVMAGRDLLQRRIGLGIAVSGVVLVLQVGLSVNAQPTVHFSRYAAPVLPLAAVALAVRPLVDTAPAGDAKAGNRCSQRGAAGSVRRKPAGLGPQLRAVHCRCLLPADAVGLLGA